MFAWGYSYSQQILSLDSCRRMALVHNNSVKIAKENVALAEELKKAAFTQFLPNFVAVGNYNWQEKNISLLGQDAHLPVASVGKNGELGIGMPTSLPKPNGDGTFSIDGLAIKNNFIIVNQKPVPLGKDGKPFDPAVQPEKLIWKNYAILPKDAMEFDMHHIFVGGVSFVQPIFMGGKIIELNKIAKYTRQIAQTKQQQVEEELIVQVDEAYWRIVSVENKVKLAKEYKALIVRLDSNMVLLQQEGLATKADMLKVKVKLNEAEVALTKAENGLNLSQMALNQLIGLPIETPLILSDATLNNLPILPKTIVPNEAVNNRSEIKMLQMALNVATSKQRIALSRFMPNIALSGNYMLSNPNMFNGYEKAFKGMFTVGITATVPIFHFGEKLHTLNASRTTATILNLQLDEAKEKITLQIQQNTYRINESLKQQITAYKNVEVAQENLRYATEGFDEGVLTATDLLMAQTAWLSAKSNYIDATVEVKLNDVYLQKSLGILHPVIENK